MVHVRGVEKERTPEEHEVVSQHDDSGFADLSPASPSSRSLAKSFRWREPLIGTNFKTNEERNH